MAKTTIHSDYIPDNAITSTKIAENSIGAREIATNAITTLYVADDSVTADKLANSINTDIALGVAALPKTGGTLSGNLRIDNSASTAVRLQLNNTGSNDYASIYADTASAYKNLILNPLGGNVGIGTSSPSGTKKLHVYSGDSGASDYGVPGLAIENDTNVSLQLMGGASHQLGITFSDSGATEAGYIYYNTGTQDLTLKVEDDVIFKSGTAETMRIDSSGNVGIDVTPSAHSSTYRALQIGSVGSIFSHASATGDGSTFFGSNIYNNSGWKYITTNEASFIQQKNGEFYFARAASGSAGAAATLSYPFVIDSSGNVGIGTTSPNDILDIRKANSQLRLTDSDDNKFVQFSYSGGKLITRNNSTSTETAQVTLIENGNFGIGTVNPEQKLHVEGRGVFDGATSSDILQIRNDSGGGVFGNSTNQFSLDLSSTSTFRVRQGSSVPFYLSASGNLHLQSASQNRIVLGSTGDDFAVNNTNNWIRGNSGSLEFNAASSGYTWECTGAPRLAMSSTGVITQTTAGTSDSYDMFLRSTDGGDPGLAITRDNVVGFGIAVRGSGNDYADLQLNTSGQTSFTEEGKIRIRGDNVTGLHGKVYVGEAESNTTDPEAVLHVRGSTMLESRVANIGLGTHTPHFTVGESGELEFMHQFVGTFSGGDTVVFTYEATAWKSWYFEVKIASTDGFYIGRAGGYNNNGGPTHNSEEGDTVMASITPSYSGQHVVVTIALDGQVHPMMKFKFACGGGEGHPKASRCKLVVNS